MYLYLANKPVAGAPDNDYRHWQVLGLMPSNRGRVAKNHTRCEISGCSFDVAIIPEEKVREELVRDPAALKLAIANGEQEVGGTPLLGSAEALRHLLAAIDMMLTELPEAYYNSLPTTMRVTLETAGRGIRAVIDKLAVMVHSTYLAEGASIITANKKLLNSILAATPSGIGWSCLDCEGKRSPALLPIDEVSENPAETTAAEMTAATTDYGFNKLAGDKPELKVKDTTREEAEANGVFLPKPDETYVVNESVAQLFKILQISRKNCPQNIRLIGPHGCGKTELAIQFAARLNLPLLIMDCANLREARDWFGYKTAREGTVYWHESQFVKAVEAGNHVILLDELNRANPHLLNTLMPLLDARRFTYLEEKGDKICVGPGTVFFASMNEGAGYTGTSALDRAIRDRFPRIVEMTYLGEKDEINLLVKRVGVDDDIATRLVQMANKIRQDATGLSATLTESMSTRQLIAAAHDFAIGGVETLAFTISNHFSSDGDDDSERVRVQNIIQGKFGDLLAAKAAKVAKKGA
jgi:hypothetical protein